MKAKITEITLNNCTLYYSCSISENESLVCGGTFYNIEDAKEFINRHIGDMRKSEKIIYELEIKYK